MCADKECQSHKSCNYLITSTETFSTSAMQCDESVQHPDKSPLPFAQ